MLAGWCIAMNMNANEQQQLTRIGVVQSEIQIKREDSVKGGGVDAGKGHSNYISCKDSAQFMASPRLRRLKRNGSTYVLSHVSEHPAWIPGTQAQARFVLLAWPIALQVLHAL